MGGRVPSSGVGSLVVRIRQFMKWPSCQALGTSKEVHTFWVNSGGLCDQGPLWAPPTKTVSVHASFTTLSNLRHARGRVLDLQVLMGWVINCHGVKPRPTNALEQNWISMSTPLVVWCWSSWVTIMVVLKISSGVYDFLRQNAGDDWWWATLHRFLPLQGLCNFSETKQRAQGLVVSHGLMWHKLLGGVVGASAHTGVGAGQSPLWVTDRDSLGGFAAADVTLWGFLWFCFTHHGKVISIHPGSVVVMKTSPLQKWWVGPLPTGALVTLPNRQWGWLGTGDCTSLAQCCRGLL